LLGELRTEARSW